MKNIKTMSLLIAVSLFSISVSVAQTYQLEVIKDVKIKPVQAESEGFKQSLNFL